MTPAHAAVGAVRARAQRNQDQASSRWTTASGIDGPADSLESAAMTVGRLTINFHPDRVSALGETVAEGLLHSGEYFSQWRTGISNGGRTAVTGGDRQRWEDELFGGAYTNVDSGEIPFPVYGAWDLLDDPHGGSPRFGSCHLVLSDDVRGRTTMCVGDSHVGPTDIGTFDAPWNVLAGLVEQADIDIAAFLGDKPGVAGARRRDLDSYVETQVHGGVDLQNDVDAVILDPSFRDTATHETFGVIADRFGVTIGWHVGSELATDEVPPDFRGETMPELARQVAQPDGVVDAAAIGMAARKIAWVPPPPAGDDHHSPLQQLKYLWHTLFVFGSDAEQGK